MPRYETTRSVCAALQIRSGHTLVVSTAENRAPPPVAVTALAAFLAVNIVASQLFAVTGELVSGAIWPSDIGQAWLAVILLVFCLVLASLPPHHHPPRSPPRRSQGALRVAR